MRHIIKPLLRQRMMPLLVVLQVALACAIACNALFLLQQKLVPILSPDGIGNPGHLIVGWQIVPRGQPWSSSRLREVEQTLRAIPGVTSVTVAGSLPMVTNTRMNGDVIGMGSDIRANSAVYIGDHLVKTLGLKLVGGRDFSATEQATHLQGVGMDRNGPTIITRALADKLFPQGRALGKVIRMGKESDAGRRTVVGVVAHLMRNDLGQGKRRSIDYTMLLPGIPGKWPVPTFGVRFGSVDPQHVRTAVESVIKRTLGAKTVRGIDPQYDMYAQLRGHALARSRAAVWLLSGVSLVVLLVTLVGIMGLTGYWVQQRTRQIGICRALGARRGNVLRDVLIENLLVVGIGVVLGLGLADAINLWLMHHYELSRLPWQYLPYGAAVMLVLGQLAVLIPARRAARVAPVVATRSV